MAHRRVPPGRTADIRRLTSPGFLDLQVNGFAGVDFNDPATTVDDLHRALGVLRAHGVTRLLPTLITSSAERFGQCASMLLQAKADAIAGIHMEGPYISPEDGPRGAHPREHCAPASIDDFKRRQDAAAGRIRLVTLAPEVPGALPLIEYLRANGIRVAIGHTGAPRRSHSRRRQGRRHAVDAPGERLREHAFPATRTSSGSNWPQTS